MRVQVAGLRMREAPDAEAPVVATLPAGTVATLLDGPEEADGLAWYMIEHAGLTGWAASGENGDWLARITNGRIGLACVGCGEGGRPATVSVEPEGSDVTPIHDEIGSVVWSPDGSRAVIEVFDPMTGPSELFLARSIGGELEPLGEGSSVAWAPDGELLAFAHRDGELLVMAIGEEPVPLLRVPHSVPSSLAWSPDGTAIAFIAVDCPDCPISEPIMGDPPMSVFLVDVATGDARRVTRGGNAGQIHWMADGSALTFLDLNLGTGVLEMRLADLDSGEVRVLADGGLLGYGHDFSPDGTRLVSGTADGIVVSAVDGSGGRTILEIAPGENPMPRNPRWSPDGEWILFDKAWITGDAIEAWIMRADGSDAVMVAELGYPEGATWQPSLEPLAP